MMGWDASTKQMILFDGCHSESGACWAEGCLSDTWSWLGNTWVQLATAHVPQCRYSGELSYDPSSRQLLLFGGWTTYFIGDTWFWTGTDWSQTTPTASPSVRARAGLAYDPKYHQLLLFGGFFEYSDPVWSSQTWAWNGTTWTMQVPASSPPPRSDAEMGWDGATHQMVLFGGDTPQSVNSNDTWIYG